MTPPPTMTSRQALLAVLLAGTLALSVGACGRRGRPEAPPDPNAPVKTQQKADAKPSRAQPTFATRPGTIAQNDDDDDDENPDQREATAAASPLPTAPGRKKSQPFVVPKEPFILDSLL